MNGEGAPDFSSVSLMCLSAAVEERNSKIDKAISTSPLPPRLSAGEIYRLQQPPGHTGTSSFLHDWPSTEIQTGLSPGNSVGVYSHRPSPCRRLVTNHRTLQAAPRNCSSFRISGDPLIRRVRRSKVYCL